MNPVLASILEKSRQNLLDLSLRNRLLNTPRGPGRSKRLDIVDELSDEVFRMLVREQKAFTFLACRGGAGEQVPETKSQELFPTTSSDGPAVGGIAERLLDSRLQTRLDEDGLQTRLLSLYYDAQTSEAEQGVSVVFTGL